MSEWPTHSEELARKSVDQLNRIAHLFGHDKISKREAFLALDVLTTAIQGLVPEDCFQTLYAALKEIKKS